MREQTMNQPIGTLATAAAYQSPGFLRKKKRWNEIFIQGFLFFCGFVSILTTIGIVFELGNWNPFMTKLLQEKFLRDFCWNRYKQSGCWIKKSDCTYTQPSGFTTGSPDTCTRQLSDCKRHTNELRFNAFPGIPGGGGYV